MLTLTGVIGCDDSTREGRPNENLRDTHTHTNTHTHSGVGLSNIREEDRM